MKVVLYILSIIFLLYILSEIYSFLRRKFLKCKVGLNNFDVKLLKNGDYVYIGERLLRFDHFTKVGEKLNPLYPPLEKNKTHRDGDLVFISPHGIGYLICSNDNLSSCKYIYCEYGLKWAYSKEWINIAKIQSKMMIDGEPFYIGNILKLRLNGSFTTFKIVDFVWDDSDKQSRYILKPQGMGLCLALTASDIHSLSQAK